MGELNRRYEKMCDLSVNNFNNTIKSGGTFFCDKCKNKGLIAFKFYNNSYDDFQVGFKDCECKARREVENNKNSSGLVGSSNKYTFGNFTINEPYEEIVLNKAKNNLVSEGWFFIGGQVGSGKTHICTAISYTLLDEGYSLKMVSWRDLMNDLKNGFNGKETFFDFNKFKNATVLYVDDFLHGKATDFELEKAFELIDYRYRYNLKTILSSELMTGEILELSQSVGSRIIEKSKGYICDISRDEKRNHRIAKK